MKKGNKGIFDVTMGSYDGAEVYELVEIYILNILAYKYGKAKLAYTETMDRQPLKISTETKQKN